GILSPNLPPTGLLPGPWAAIRSVWQPLFFHLCNRCVVRNLVQACVSGEDRRHPRLEVDESEEITVAVRADDLLKGNTADPNRHPIAIVLHPQDEGDDARVTKKETLVRRGKKWFRYDAPDKRLFKQLQKTLTG